MTPKFLARIDSNGRFNWFDFGLLKTYLAQFSAGEVVQVSIQKPKKRATDPQRRYYWAVIVTMISDEIGDDKESVHLSLREKFLSVETDNGLKRIRSTEELTTVEREEYHEQVRRWAAQWLSMYIPLPNEVEF